MKSRSEGMRGSVGHMGAMWCSPVHRKEASQVVRWQLRKLRSRAFAISRLSHASTSCCRLEEVAHVRDPSDALGQVERAV